MVVENVKGAQPWVGSARWHYGSFYLWGDVPALMPFTERRVGSGIKQHGSGAEWFDTGIAALPSGSRGAKNGDSFGWSKDTPLRNNNSRSPARKAASAMIAKIPFPLAEYIARTFKP